MSVITRKDVFLTALEMKVHKAHNSMGSVSTNLPREPPPACPGDEGSVFPASRPGSASLPKMATSVLN